MRFFYDTEFLENGTTIDLISIGIAAEDGREYYAVNSDLDEDRITKHQWLSTNVWPKLPLRGFRPPYREGGPGPSPDVDYARNTVQVSSGRLNRESIFVKPKWVIANEVRAFLENPSSLRGDNELWGWYSAYDHVALCQLWAR